MNGRQFLIAISAAVLAGASPFTTAQAQPAGPVAKLVWPYPPGGIPDALARYLREELEKGTRQTWIVENRAGAAGRTGTMAVARADPDGNTIMLATVAMMSVYPIVYSNLGYDPLKDFEPITQVSRFDLALTTAPKLNVRSLSEYIAWVKANPGQANYSTPAAGSLPHFFTVQFARAANINLTYVPYQGATPAIQDVIAGHLPMGFFGTTEVAELHKAGQVRILAVSGAKRSEFVPDVPSFRELGYDFQAYGWFGLFAPARTPADMVQRLNKVMVDALKSPAGQERLRGFGMEPTGTSSAELARIMRADFEHWTPIVKASGFTPTK